MFVDVVMSSCRPLCAAERRTKRTLFIAGLETGFLGRSGTGTAWPVLFSPLRNPLVLKDEEATSMTLASSGEHEHACLFLSGLKWRYNSYLRLVRWSSKSVNPLHIEFLSSGDDARLES